MSTVYVYALLGGVRRRPRARGRRLEFLQASGICVAVERMKRAPRVSERALRRQHDLVVRLSRSSSAVLPARFGTLVEEDELRRVLRLRRTVLRRSLKQVSGKVQMTVRILGAVRPRPAARSHRSASGTAFLRAKSAEALPHAARILRKGLHLLVEDERVDRGAGRIVATLHHLVVRNRVARYRTLVRTLVQGLDPESAVTVSGPWPPFAFVPDLFDPGQVASA